MRRKLTVGLEPERKQRKRRTWMKTRPWIQVPCNRRKLLTEAEEVVAEGDGVAGPDADCRMPMAIRQPPDKEKQQAAAAVAVALLVDFEAKAGDVAAGFPHRG